MSDALKKYEYYRDESSLILCGDCREILPLLEPVDLVLTDPPYVNLQGGFDRKPLVAGAVGKKKQSSVAVGDVWRANLEWAEMAWNATTLGVMVCCAHKSVAETRAAFPLAETVALLTWFQRNAAPTGKNVPWYKSEFVWALKKAVGLRWDALDTTVFDIPALSAGCFASERLVDASLRAIHPAQKPQALFKRLLAVDPRHVLDPFMGSGTTLRAAKDLGLKSIGIEINEAYCAIAAKRLSQEVFAFEPAITSAHDGGLFHENA